MRWPTSGSRAAGLAMAFKLVEAAQARWRAVNAPHLVALVRAGARFANGHLVERPDESGGEAQAAWHAITGLDNFPRDLQREINSGLNVAESWNRANAEIFYGKARDIASNRRDEQEMSVLCLHILQTPMVYVNTLMLQDVLAEDEWPQLLTSEDYRGLTPLTWAHVATHGEFKLNMNSRLDLGHTSP
jgi:hypothetical protein